MARTPKTVEDRRAQIIDAALQVFAAKGFMRATNKDIAAAAGITPGLIYHYFASKEALLKALIEQQSPLTAMQALTPQMETLPPAALLRTLLLHMLRLVEAEPFVQLLRVFLPEVIHNADLAPLGLASYRQASLFLEQYLATKMASGELRPSDPALVAQVLMSGLMGFVLRRQILHDPVALEYTQEQIVAGVVDSALPALLPN